MQLESRSFFKWMRASWILTSSFRFLFHCWRRKGPHCNFEHDRVFHALWLTSEARERCRTHRFLSPMLFLHCLVAGGISPTSETFPGQEGHCQICTCNHFIQHLSVEEIRSLSFPAMAALATMQHTFQTRQNFGTICWCVLEWFSHFGKFP